MMQPRGSQPREAGAGRELRAACPARIPASPTPAAKPAGRERAEAAKEKGRERGAAQQAKRERSEACVISSW